MILNITITEVRDACGLFLRARSSIIRGARSPKEAEAMSIREALSWMKNWRVNNCVFESDSKLLIDALDGPDGSSLFHTIVENCSELVKHYENVLFEFIPKSANSVVHEIIRAVYSSTRLKEWYDTASDFILCNLLMVKYYYKQVHLFKKKYNNNRKLYEYFF